MFEISEQYNLDICGPSFTRDSKLSHAITIHKPNILLTYTSFVEVNVPLFSKCALHKLMEKLDYSLIGWGIDFLYIFCNGVEKKKSYAIIHKVICKNPKDNKKPEGRELKKIAKWNQRSKIWKEFAKKHKMPERGPITQYKSIYY